MMTALTRNIRQFRRQGLSDRQLGSLLVLPSGIMLLAFAAFPFLQASVDSLFEIDFLSRSRTWVGLRNYTEVVQSPEIRAAFLRSVVWTAGNVVIQVVLGVMVALLLNAKLKGQTVARGLVLVPYMVPAVVVALVFRYMFNDVTGLFNYLLLKLGILDQPVDLLGSPTTVLPTLVVVNCWKYVPFVVIVVLARLQTVPGSLFEAAVLDGAGRWLSFRHVTLPWIMPVVIVAMLLRTIWTAYDFDVPYLLAFGGPLDSSTTLPIQIRKLAFNDQALGTASALSVCVAILLVAGAVIYLRAYRRSEHNDE